MVIIACHVIWPFQTVVSAQIPLIALSVTQVLAATHAHLVLQLSINYRMFAMNALQQLQIASLARVVRTALSAKIHLH